MSETNPKNLRSQLDTQSQMMESNLSDGTFVPWFSMKDMKRLMQSPRCRSYQYRIEVMGGLICWCQYQYTMGVKASEVKRQSRISNPLNDAPNTSLKKKFTELIHSQHVA